LIPQNADKIVVQVRYKEIEKIFSADNVEDIWLLLDSFFHEFVPSFNIASKLSLSVNLAGLAKDLEGVVAFSPEGANLLLSKNKLTDNETLVLWLLASYIGQKLGKFEKDSLSKEELQGKLGKSGKITSTRLGELVKNDLVSRLSEDRYRITTFGVAQVQKDILPRIQAKICQ